MAQPGSSPPYRKQLQHPAVSSSRYVSSSPAALIRSAGTCGSTYTSNSFTSRAHQIYRRLAGGWVGPKGKGFSLQEDRAQSCKAASTRGDQGGNDWLGTWAKRQVHYAQPPPPSLPAHIPGTPQPSDRSVARRPLRSTDGEGNDAAKCTDDTATTSICPENNEEGAAGMHVCPLSLLINKTSMQLLTHQLSGGYFVVGMYQSGYRLCSAPTPALWSSIV